MLGVQSSEEDAMEPHSLMWVGSPCGRHGPHVFYRAVRFQLAGRRLLSLGDFFLVRCAPGEPVCIAELQLLWEERTTRRLLSSSKLYFLPEDTPSGRTVRHGEDEVIAVSEKVIVQLEQLVQWTVWDPTAWGTGSKVTGETTDPCCAHPEAAFSRGPTSREHRGEKPERGGSCGRLLVRSYLQYCRYRAVLSRLRGRRPSSLLQEQLLLALGGIASWSAEESAPRVLYCRDTFQHPALPGSQGPGLHLAPSLKGRPRKKKKPPLCLRPDSQGQSQSKVDKVDPPKPKCSSGGHSNRSSHAVGGGRRALLSCSEERKERRGGGAGGRGAAGGGTEEQAFLVSLYKYMKERKTPIQRIPYLGFKQINLWTMFQAAQKLGGYELITARRQWKQVYDELGGNPGSTSAATCTRRHYERLILPYERFSTGDEDVPPPPLKARRRGHAAAQGSSHAPEVQPTNGVHPQEGRVTAPQEQTVAAESSEKVLRLKLEPQTTKPSHPRGQRRHTVREDEGSEIQLTLKEQTREMTEMNRRSKFNLRDGDHSSLETDGKMESDIVLQSPTTKALARCHVALGLWKAEDLDHCHVGMVSPTLERPESPSQSPLTVEEPSSERADLPRREQAAVVGFTPLLSSPERVPGIMSPLAKKKLTSQVCRAESPGHKRFLHSVGAPSPLIHRGLTNGVLVEAAGQPIRPSVIKHVHSFRTQGDGEKLKDGGESKGAQEVEDTGAPVQQTSLLSHRSTPRVHACTDPEDHVQQRLSSPAPSAPLMHRRATTPPGFFNDHYISSHHPHRRNESYPEPGPEQEPRTGLSVGQGQAVTENAALIPSGTHRAESCLVFPRKSVKTESQAFSLKQQLHWRNTSFTNEVSHGVSTQRQWRQVSSLPKDTESCAHSSLAPLSCPDSSHISHVKDTMSADGDNSLASGAADEQPTDLSLPKASSLKPFTRSSFLERLSCPSPGQDGAQLSDTTSRSPSQSAQRTAGVAYRPRACRVPPMSVCDVNSHAAMNSSRRCPAGGSWCRAAGATGHGQTDAGPRGGLEKGERGEAGGQYGRPREAMDVTGEQACALRPILQSLATQQKVCTTRPLKRPMDRMAESSSSERKIRAVSPMHAATSFASSTSASSSLTPPPKYTLASLCERRKSQMSGEKCNGSAHAVAVLKPLEASPQIPRDFPEAEEQPTGSPAPAAPHAFPAALYRPAGGFSLTQLSGLCGDPLGWPSSAPPSLPHHTLEYLKSRSAAVLSPLVPPFAIHSFMMQRQQLAHAAASPVPMAYRHPLAAAAYGDLHPHRLYPLSLSSQPAYGPPQLNSVHSSTKLS